MGGGDAVPAKSPSRSRVADEAPEEGSSSTASASASTANSPMFRNLSKRGKLPSSQPGSPAAALHTHPMQVRFVSLKHRAHRAAPLAAVLAAMTLALTWVGFNSQGSRGPMLLRAATGGSGSGWEDCPTAPIFEEDAAASLGSVAEHFNASDPVVVAFARLADRYLAQWSPIKGAAAGLGSTGMITPDALRHVGRLWLFMACCGHVKVVDGRVYFRYGGFYTVWYRLLRFTQSVKMIQDAVDTYNLTSLRVEFFVNTCDHPMSFFSGHWPGRAGFPVLSTELTEDTMDVGIPDPLDLTDAYNPDLALQVPWAQKQPKAVFRGATTNFQLSDGNWGANTRLRLHRLTDAHAELIDARVSRWSHATTAVQAQLKGDGFLLGNYMNQTEMSGFKYQVVADGGGGSCRTCGVLRSNQLTLRQDSPFQQFYEPLLEDGVHVVTVQHTYDDLPEKVRWAQKNDERVRAIIRNANTIGESSCTWSGRRLYWGVLLVKYQAALARPQNISAPTELCGTPLPELRSDVPAEKAPLTKCVDPEVDTKQAPCTFFCIGTQMNETKYVWLSSDVLKDTKRIGPP